jgi:hypothetical protein
MSISSAAVLQGIGGVFYLSDYYNPACSMVSPVAAGIRAGAGGAGIGRFGWVDANGIVLNTRTNDSDMLGIVLPDIPLNSDWRNVFYDDVSCSWRIREGLPVTVLSVGKIGLRFRYGAQPSAPVYASLLDGRAISGYSADSELTPWLVATPAAADAIATITTWSKYT